MSDSNISTPKGRFSRPEAQAFDYGRLTHSQKEAVIRILKILESAHEELINIRKERDHSNAFQGFISVPEKNSSRVLLLSGGRGSGKTSVLYSLLKFLRSGDEKCDERERIEDLDENYKKLKEYEYEDKKEEWDRIFETINIHKLYGFKKIEPENNFNEKKNVVNKVIEELKRKKQFFAKCHEVSKKFIWLQPLEMETLPSPANLLAAILNRIDEAVYRFRGPHPKTHQSPLAYSPYQLNPDEHDVMLEFTKLQKDVALAWDGNIEKRAAHLDPDLYAVEVLRAEHKRLKLNDRITKSLNDLHNFFIKPCTREEEHLFVLPIDDFDLNPHRCLELIRLIRILNVPRLFTLILGDIWLIRTFMNFKYFQSIENSGSNQGSTLSNIRYDECELAHNLSGGANRKLFVPANIISLKRMEINEVYQFRQTADAEKKIEDYLKDIKGININTAYHKEGDNKLFCFGKLEIKKQHDLFNQKVDDLIVCEESEEEKDKLTRDRKPESENEYFYIRNEFYALYPRLAQDIYLKLYQDSCSERNFDADKNKIDKQSNYLTYAKRIYKARIRQERGLTTGSSIFLDGIIRNNFQGNLRLDISAIDLEYTYGQPLIFQQPKANAFININLPEDWYVKLTHPLKSGGMEEVRLNEQTGTALIFVHDLLAFSDPTRIVGDNLMLKNGPPLWACTQWPFGSDAYPIKVPWYFPPWQTMFECDLLRRCWIEVWKWSSDIAKNAGDDVDSKLINVLVYLWLRITTNILSKPDNCRHIRLQKQSIKIQKRKKKGIYYKTISLDTFQKFPGDLPWEELSSHIRDLYGNEKDKTKKREQIIRGFFAAIGSLLAPETNIPKWIREIFTEDRVFQEILVEAPIADGTRKLRAQSAVLFFDNGALKMLKYLFAPQIKENLEPKEQKEVIDHTSDFINDIEGHCLCPFVEDIVMQSKLNYEKKDEFQNKLLG